MQLSAEKYIQTKARGLPIHEVYISRNWQLTGLISIVVSRLHPQGNVTGGVFLVDSKCLGVKNAFYLFNYDFIKYKNFIEEQINRIDLIKCEYVLAHNIIYGAVEFANEFKISPCKEFNVVKHLLEEDTEEIEYLDIEFGEGGTPHLIINPECLGDKKYKANLVKFAGKGNYFYTEYDGYQEIIESNYFNGDENHEEDEFEVDEDVLQRLIKVFENIDITNNTNNFTPVDEVNKIKNDLFEIKDVITNSYKSVYTDYEINTDQLLSLFLTKIFRVEDKNNLNLDETIVLLAAKEYNKILEITTKSLREFPNDPQTLYLIASVYDRQNQFEKCIEFAKNIIKDNPQSLIGHGLLLNYGLVLYKNEEVFKEFIHTYFENGCEPYEIATDIKYISTFELEYYLVTLVKYHCIIAEIETAEMYSHELSLIQNSKFAYEAESYILAYKMSILKKIIAINK